MRLLLIEDEEKVSRFIVKGLMAERFAVDLAAEGARGLELAQTYSYDLVILDLMLPGLSGTEVLRLVRQQNERVPVLVLTARDAVTDKVRKTKILRCAVRRNGRSEWKASKAKEAVSSSRRLWPAKSPSDSTHNNHFRGEKHEETFKT